MTGDDIERTAAWLERVAAALPESIAGRTDAEVEALVRVAATALRAAVDENARLVERIGEMAEQHNDVLAALWELQELTGVDATWH